MQAARQLAPDGSQPDGGEHHEKDLGTAEHAVEREVRRDAEQP